MKNNDDFFSSVLQGIDETVQEGHHIRETKDTYCSLAYMAYGLNAIALDISVRLNLMLTWEAKDLMPSKEKGGES